MSPPSQEAIAQEVSDQREANEIRARLAYLEKRIQTLLEDRLDALEEHWSCTGCGVHLRNNAGGPHFEVDRRGIKRGWCARCWGESP